MKPAWTDEDDSRVGNSFEFSLGNKLRVNKVVVDSTAKNLDEAVPQECRKRLRENYKIATIVGENPRWARISEGDDAEELLDEEGEETNPLQQLARSASSFVSKSKSLLPKHLNFAKQRDITVGHQNGPVSDLKFHPSKPVLAKATTSGIVSLFEICDAERRLDLKKSNFFLQDVQLPQFRIENIDFFNEGLSLFASSTNQNCCYSYDLLEGKVTLIKQPIVLFSSPSKKVRLSADGKLVGHLANVADVLVFDLKTMEHLHTFRGAETLVDFCFATFDRNIIHALAENGTVYTWNLCSRSQQQKFFDHGCVRATCMATSCSGQFVACGSSSGIVNVYDVSSNWKGDSECPSPTFTLGQLTTSVSFAKFSRDAQMVAYGSDVKHMAAKLAHCSTGTVFPNFPSKQENFSHDKLTCCDISPNSAYFAIGSKQGGTRLYRMKHFDTY